jgi:hypothetical protein
LGPGPRLCAFLYAAFLSAGFLVVVLEILGPQLATRRGGGGALPSLEPFDLSLPGRAGSAHQKEAKECGQTDAADSPQDLKQLLKINVNATDGHWASAH